MLGSLSPGHHQLETPPHINNLEMRAVRLALSHFTIPPMSRVLVTSDITTVVAYINRVGDKVLVLLEGDRLFVLTGDHTPSICTRFIPGRMNVIAEELSRAGQILLREWSLHQDIVNLIFQQWGHPNLDLCAMRFNTQVSNLCVSNPRQQISIN